MNCLNCNKETTGTNVFCDQCRQAMEDYPVQKGTPVTIPAQPSPINPKKQATHHFASAEDQLAAAQRTTRRLAFSLIALSLLLMITVVAFVYITLFGIPAFLFA